MPSVKSILAVPALCVLLVPLVRTRGPTVIVVTVTKVTTGSQFGNSDDLIDMTVARLVTVPVILAMAVLSPIVALGALDALGDTALR